MRSLDEARRWFDQAEDDLGWARVLLREGGFNLACFLSQQVAEKALKALLYNLGEDAVLGHSVRELCERAAAIVPELSSRCDSWGSLDGFYITTRYPDALPGSIPARVFDRAVAERAVAGATEVVEEVRARLA